jgi:MoaA/NifB/PqqE/SkfB family radical SAM enzyme
MNLDDIGFYTMREDRCASSDETTPIMRAELILTDKCNFSCPYCRGLRSDIKGDMPLSQAYETLDLLIKEGLTNIRFSGGEPTIYPGLERLVAISKKAGVQKIAVSTNGTASLEQYKELIEAGVNDFSISLDSCCASFNKEMTGGVDAFDIVTSNIAELSKLTYVTIGIVITEDNYSYVPDIVEFAHNLGVADIRIIPAAQWDKMLEIADRIPKYILDAHPILKYRVENIRNGIHVRGIKESDSHKCGLAIDDLCIVKDNIYACVIAMREQQDPIGKIGPNFRQEMKTWVENTDTHLNETCKQNCLDCCCLFNNKHEAYRSQKEEI